MILYQTAQDGKILNFSVISDRRTDIVNLTNQNHENS